MLLILSGKGSNFLKSGTSCTRKKSDQSGTKKSLPHHTFVLFALKEFNTKKNKDSSEGNPDAILKKTKILKTAVCRPDYENDV
jgi:hypothetical protein